MTSIEQTRALWAAVDMLTKPSERKIDRDTDDAGYLAELGGIIASAAETNGDGRACSVPSYRYRLDALMARRTAGEARYGRIPSLWDQAEAAVTQGREMQEGGTPSPASSRSPADLDLMEQLLTIRETMPWQLAGRGLTPRASIPDQIRQLAAHVLTHEPQHVDWWAYRFGQWARLIGTYLQAIDTGPKPLRLRNAPCPLCKTRQVTIDQDGEPMVVPPILIDFENGWIRAATCTACSATWWRGNELGDLATALETTDQHGRMTA